MSDHTLVRHKPTEHYMSVSAGKSAKVWVEGNVLHVNIDGADAEFDLEKREDSLPQLYFGGQSYDIHSGKPSSHLQTFVRRLEYVEKWKNACIVIIGIACLVAIVLGSSDLHQCFRGTSSVCWQYWHHSFGGGGTIHFKNG